VVGDIFIKKGFNPNRSHLMSTTPTAEDPHRTWHGGSIRRADRIQSIGSHGFLQEGILERIDAGRIQPSGNASGGNRNNMGRQNGSRTANRKHKIDDGDNCK